MKWHRAIFRRNRELMEDSPGKDYPHGSPHAAEPEPSGTVADQFLAAWSAIHDPATAGPELLPVRLARACVAVLPVDGAGLSVLNGDFLAFSHPSVLPRASV